MKSIYLKIIALFIIGSTQSYSVDTTNSIDTDAHFIKSGLTAHPLKLGISDDSKEASVAEFREFQKQQQLKKEASLTYSTIKSFMRNVAKLEMMDMQKLEKWISRPLDTDSPSNQKRELFLSIEEVTEILNNVFKASVTFDQISLYLKESPMKQKASQRFLLLKAFAIKELSLPCHEVEDLSSLLMENAMPHHFPDTIIALKCDFGLPLKMVSGRVGRDISKEFDEYEKDCREKQGRIDLYQDLQDFFMLGSTASTAIPMQLHQFTVSEIIGNEPPRMAVRKGLDLSLLLVHRKHSILNGLLTGFDDRFRAIGRFIVCRQLNIQPETAHPELYKCSLVSFGPQGIVRNGQLLTTVSTQFALSPWGDLCINPNEPSMGMVHHSYFFQQDNIGIPLACAGSTEVKNGKITTINNHSGHYSPLILQLFLAVAYLHEKGAVDENLVLNHFTGVNSNLILQDILNIAKVIQLN